MTLRDQSLTAAVSLRMRQTDGGATRDEIREIKNALTPAQMQRIHDKQQWEQCSFLAVLRDWPSLFEPEAQHA